MLFLQPSLDYGSLKLLYEKQLKGALLKRGNDNISISTLIKTIMKTKYLQPMI